MLLRFRHTTAACLTLRVLFNAFLPSCICHVLISCVVGAGLFVYPDGSHYSGEFENGKKHGHGTYTYANGDVYVGEFQNDLKHGRGLYSVKAYPSSYEGTWVNGQLANGSSFHYHDGSSYTGDFHSNAPANNGKWTAASGSVTHGAYVTFSKAKDSEETYVAWRNNVSV
jgi:hypothetical protein